MTIVPVGVVQVGCTVTLAVGAGGAAGRLLTVIEEADETQPVVIFLTVRL
jgi:hypothetical protein